MFIVYVVKLFVCFTIYIWALVSNYGGNKHIYVQSLQKQFQVGLMRKERVSHTLCTEPQICKFTDV